MKKKIILLFEYQKKTKTISPVKMEAVLKLNNLDKESPWPTETTVLIAL